MKTKRHEERYCNRSKYYEIFEVPITVRDSNCYVSQFQEKERRNKIRRHRKQLGIIVVSDWDVIDIVKRKILHNVFNLSLCQTIMVYSVITSDAKSTK